MLYFLAYEQINDLLNALRTLGYTCMGPQVQDGTIVFDELNHAAQLPWGVHDMQKPGYYRLQQSEKKEAFAWANGPQAIKPLLFKPKESLWRVQKNDDGKLIFKEIMPDHKPVALIGARSCDLAAMAIQDKTLASRTSIRYCCQLQLFWRQLLLRVYANRPQSNLWLRSSLNRSR